MKRVEATAFEVYVQFLVVAYSVFLVGWAAIGAIQEGYACPSDTLTYWLAARFMQADFDTWVYPDYARHFFVPLTWFNPMTAYLLLSGASIVSSIIVIHKLAKVSPYALLIIPLLAIPYRFTLQVGNVNLILLALATNPYTALIPILLKPHWVVFPILFAIAARRRSRIPQRDTQD